MLPVLKLREIEALDFEGKGEAFVESRFITPLLDCLGYESHKDYEVIRHGDDKSRFRLYYPPVESGSQRVKEYSPDYLPTIRKKMFWVIEAKSPKDVSYPFSGGVLMQGFQYCIHPDVQAKFLMVSNGAHTSVYDVHGAVFLGTKMYTPVMEFRSTELVAKWTEIFRLLSVETLSTRIEQDLKAMYDKLCLSSLDKSYPNRLLAYVGASAVENSRQIERHVYALVAEEFDREMEAWQSEMEKIDAGRMLALMDRPFHSGPRQEGTYFVDKSLASQITGREIFQRLVDDFDRKPVFRKLQSFYALCHLYQRTEDGATKELCRDFFERYKDAQLPLLTEVECAALRVTRKVLVLDAYPLLRKRLEDELETAAELVRFVRRPTALSLTYRLEVAQNATTFTEIKGLRDDELQSRLSELLKIESRIDGAFWEARKNLPDSEKQMVIGFENYGDGGKLFQFMAMLRERGIEPPL